jgi:osmotically-inducible protein OsmY
VSNVILVTVRHGVVQLTGKVRDEGQRAQAERVAGHIGAVFAVDNRLAVDEDLVLPPRGRNSGFRAFRSP